MKHLVLFAITSMVFMPSVGFAQEPVKQGDNAKTKTVGMTNQDAVDLLKAGFSEDLVVARIKAATAKSFDLSASALISLKRAGATERVITAMLGVEPPTVSVTPPQSTPSTMPQHIAVSMAPTSTKSIEGREAGIYLEEDGKLVPLEPTVFSQGKSGGFLTSALTYGIKKAKWKAVVRSRAANLRLRTAQPVFYFYFENKGSGLSNTGGFTGWLAGASSPNEFVLVKMEQKKNERELIVGEFGMLGASSGTRSEDTVDMKIEKLSPGIYKVSPASPLKAGSEYCLFYASGSQTTMGGGGGGGKLFDFGVDVVAQTAAR